MDQPNVDEQGLLRYGGEGVCYGPHGVNGGQSEEIIKLPNVNYRVFQNARVSATSSSVIRDDNQVFVERVIHPDQQKFEYVGGQIFLHGRDIAIVRVGDAEKINRGIFLGGNGSYNYYHWLVEILPKSQFFSLLPSSYANYPLLVSEDVERIPTFRETINLFIRDRKVILLKKDLSYVVDNLIYINSPSNLPFNLRKGERVALSYSRISGSSIRYVRDAALAKHRLLLHRDVTYPKRIFLGRKGKRRKYNENEVFQYLEKSGFVKIFMEELSFEEQVAVVHQAECIVGPTGAAWANLIFCQPGAKCLCWMAEEYGEFSAYSTIARVVGADLRYITYKTGARSTRELYEKDYNINVSSIGYWLSNLENLAAG